MLFNSLEFIIFFPIVVLSYFIIPPRFRWALLLLASYYFYMCWKMEYVLLIIASTVIDYYAGMKMGAITEKKKRKIYLLISLIANLGLLFSFKYFNFFNDSTRLIFDSMNIFYYIPMFNVLLPVGISFYTFQTLSYTIDIYRGKRKPEKHFGIFAVYVSFFPQLVAGPIERSSRLLPQFHKVNNFNSQKAIDGLKLMAWGFFKKLVIADRLAVYVNSVYNNPNDFTGIPIIIATYFFAFQIYCDFSGYSDIAIGSARVLGYDLMINFKRPYRSQSVREFWQRWHISLSSWFKDYLYVSLGGNKVGRWRWGYNILIVFLLSGFWHGADWTFMIWGSLHGFYFLISNMTAGLRQNLVRLSGLIRLAKLHSIVRTLITFHLVLFAWIFFRANSLSDAVLILKRISILEVDQSASSILSGFSTNSVIGSFEFCIAILAIIFMEIIQRFYDTNSFALYTKNNWTRKLGYCALVTGVLIFGVFEHAEFIYFQF